MFILTNRDLELTCDELTIRRLGTEAKEAYAYSIIGMAELRNKFTSLLYNGFSKNAAVERIESIMKMKKKSIVSLASAFVMVTAFTIGTLTAFSASEQYDSPAPPPVEEKELPVFDGSFTVPTSGLRSFRSLEELQEYVSNRFGYDVEVKIMGEPFDLSEFRDLNEFRGTLPRIIDFDIIDFDMDTMFNNVFRANAPNALTRLEAFDVERADIIMLPRNADELAAFLAEEHDIEFPPMNVITSRMLYFSIIWDGGMVNISNDTELYALIQDGATIIDILKVLAAR
jgi:hypothetical protein